MNLNDRLLRGDLELEHIPSEEQDSETTPTEYDISVYPADFTLEILYQKWKKEELTLPKFQRSFVWTKNQSSRLIESFMMGLPVPPVFLYTSKDQKNLVVDGNQRLRSVFYFFDGFFGEVNRAGRRQVFRISGINEKSKIFNKTYEEFDETEKSKFRDSVLRAIIIKQLDPNDDTSIYHIFERLNTGGTPLKDQEVRNCIYDGKLNELLNRLNDLSQWRQILGKAKPDSRKKDVELILRYLSLFHNQQNYRKPMKDFLSGYMAKNRNPNESFLTKEEERFEETCKIIVDKLGIRPFNPKGSLNPSIFDSVFVAFAKNYRSCPSDIRQRFDTLIQNEDFKKLTRDATTDPTVVNSRIDIASTILFG